MIHSNDRRADPTADLFLLLGRERESRLAAAAIVESRQALCVVPSHPTLANATGQADGHRGGRRLCSRWDRSASFSARASRCNSENGR